MKLLFLGDVVGDSGCRILESELYRIKNEYGIDVTVINGENSAVGNGITPESYQRLVSIGADVITTGNHAFRRREIMDMYDEKDHLLRPANYPEGVPGKGVCILDMGAYQLAVVDIMGTMFMDALDNPFQVIDELLEDIHTPNIIVDIHAETTSEKKAMGFYLQGRVSAVLGTHTHVQTADETILGGHTAYITDVGMVGPEDSVLGVDSKCVIEKFKYHMPVRFTESTSPAFINGVIIDIDHKLGKATKIERLIWKK